MDSLLAFIGRPPAKRPKGRAVSGYAGKHCEQTEQYTQSEDQQMPRGIYERKPRKAKPAAPVVESAANDCKSAPETAPENCKRSAYFVVWDDGRVEIHDDNDKLIMLAPHEARRLVEFITRLCGQ
jgi:hypothetical protein